MVIKIRELIGVSEKSFDDALNSLIEHEVKKGKNITGAQIVSQNVSIKEGKIAEYRVNVKVAYAWKEE